MIKLTGTRFFESVQHDLAPGVSIDEEGQPLSYVKVGGKTFVQPSNGGKDFAGISVSRNAPPASVPMVEEGVVGAGGVITLQRAAIANKALVKVDGAAVTPASIAGNLVTVDAGDVGKEYSVQYAYAPTTAEARTILGDHPYGGHAANLMGTIGTFKRGEISTSFYDVEADWTDVLYVKLGNGVFIPGTANDHVPNVKVLNSPNAGEPFLKLQMVVA